VEASDCESPAPIGQESKPEVDFDAEPSQPLEEAYEQHQKKHRQFLLSTPVDLQTPPLIGGVFAFWSPQAPANFAFARTE
jgi:hypothetical protein